MKFLCQNCSFSPRKWPIVSKCTQHAPAINKLHNFLGSNQIARYANKKGICDTFPRKGKKNHTIERDLMNYMHDEIRQGY